MADGPDQKSARPNRAGRKAAARRERERRLAEALRANLRRRKDRSRKKEAAAPPGDPKDTPERS